MNEECTIPTADTADSIPVWPTRECTPWCTTKDHSNEHPHDRSCYGPTHRVLLTQRPPVDYGDRGGHVWAMDAVEIRLRRHAENHVGMFAIYDETNNCDIEMTRAEAEELVTALVELLALEKRGQR